MSFEELRKSLLVLGPGDAKEYPSWDRSWRDRLLQNLEILTRQLWLVGIREVYAEAIAEFQKILDHPGLILADPIGAVARLQLGRAWIFAGDKQRARAAYQDFFDILQQADPEVPILKRAKSEYGKL